MVSTSTLAKAPSLSRPIPFGPRYRVCKDRPNGGYCWIWDSDILQKVRGSLRPNTPAGMEAIESEARMLNAAVSGLRPVAS